MVTLTGIRQERRISSSQELLIYFLWSKFGGAGKVAKLLGIPWYHPHNWLSRGCVPPKKIDLVSKKLKVHPAGLNYKLYRTMNGDLTWPEVVSQYKLSNEERKKLIKLGEPK